MYMFAYYAKAHEEQVYTHSHFFDTYVLYIHTYVMQV